MRQLCLLHANCQGDPLAFLLQSTPAFAERFEIRRYVNYLKEPIPSELLQRCAVFLFQPLGEGWNELASSRLQERLSAACLCLQLPNMFFKGYWPFWTNKGPLDFGDSFLDHLADSGLTLPEAMHVYLRGNLDKKFDLDAIVADCLDREREKERGAVCQTSKFVARTWRSRQVFGTINHPGRELLLMVADAVLAALGLPPVAEPLRRNCPLCEDDFELPIHPAVGAHFGLPFVSAERTYAVYGRPMTFAQYAACYMECRLRNIPNFIAYLHRVPL